MNNIYPSKELVRIRFNIEDHNTCSICENDVEITDQVFSSFYILIHIYNL